MACELFIDLCNHWPSHLPSLDDDVNSLFGKYLNSKHVHSLASDRELDSWAMLVDHEQIVVKKHRIQVDECNCSMPWIVLHGNALSLSLSMKRMETSEHLNKSIPCWVSKRGMITRIFPFFWGTYLLLIYKAFMRVIKLFLEFIDFQANCLPGEGLFRRRLFCWWNSSTIFRRARRRWGGWKKLFCA